MASTTEILFNRVKQGYAEEVARGEHDGACEWRDEGHFLCHCTKRKREAEGFTEPPGELIYQNPLCPRCGNEVNHDGDAGFVCETCHVSWATADPFDPGSFNDDYGVMDGHLRIDAAKAAVPAVAAASA